jgi:hypothetical protein
MLRWSSRSSMAAAIIGSSKIYSRVGTGAAVRTVHLAAPAADEDQASAGARSAPTALLHPWKAAVPLPLSRSMQRDSRVGLRGQLSRSVKSSRLTRGGSSPVSSVVASRRFARSGSSSTSPSSSVTPRRRVCATTRGSLTRRLSTRSRRRKRSARRAVTSPKRVLPSDRWTRLGRDALARPGDHRRCADLAIYLHLTKALCRTRTGDPFLTMEVLYQLS